MTQTKPTKAYLFLIANFCLVVIVVFFFLGGGCDLPVSEFYVPMFRNTVSFILVAGRRGITKKKEYNKRILHYLIRITCVLNNNTSNL